MKNLAQRTMHCPCGRMKMVARGLCATCYALKRQDDRDFDGKREAVLNRDGRRCRVCPKTGRRKRSVAVHHRVPGISEEDLMITLCLGCHAKVTRTLFMDKCWPPLLIALWREQHPEAYEQLQMNFTVPVLSLKQVSLFEYVEQAMEMPIRGKPEKRKGCFPTFPPLLEARR